MYTDDKNKRQAVQYYDGLDAYIYTGIGTNNAMSYELYVAKDKKKYASCSSPSLFCFLFHRGRSEVLLYSKFEFENTQTFLRRAKYGQRSHMHVHLNAFGQRTGFENCND